MITTLRTTYDKNQICSSQNHFTNLSIFKLLFHIFDHSLTVQTYKGSFDKFRVNRMGPNNLTGYTK